ncbi:MAG TPA: ABC transporter permease [Gemmatimonadaceae bacterium]|jgi:ABC-type polysaccharide/polyol phosphate export permease|nr:ABC transporter permease [Gemmatimonadaceae bacterium]
MTATTPLGAGRAATPTPRAPRPSIVQIVGEIWESRDLVVQFVLRDLTLRYTQAVMGFAWALLMPILIVGAGMMFRVVLATLANSPLEGSSIASLAAKALPWAFFSGALSQATSSVIGNSNLISKVYFPREVLPLSTVIAQSPDLVVGLVVVASVMPFIDKTGLSWSGLWVIAVLLLLMLFTVGCALFLSCANLFFRDVKYIVQVLLNFGVFATPVFFEPQMLGPKGASIMMVLPLSPFIQAMDVALVHGHSLAETIVVASRKGDVVVWAPWMLAYAAGWSLFLIITGIYVFRSGSSRFAEMA